MTVENVLYTILMGVLLWALLQSWLSCKRTETIHPIKAYIFLTFYYLPYLLFPWLVLILWQWYHAEISHIQAISMLLINLLMIYARFIEPNHIRVKFTDLALDENRPLTKPVKVALIADLHIGLFSGREQQLKKIVKKINLQQPDLVIVAGDWTYEPENCLAEDLHILQTIHAPIYSVNGNHDEQRPGPPIAELLAEALAMNHIMDIEDKIVEFDEFRLIGFGDLWAGKADLDVLATLPQDKPWLIVAHNPDCVDLVPALDSRPLMLSGHTHGGQIELPWITSYMMKKISILGHKRGYYQHQTANVYVTVGTGMIGAPFRFRVPPTIDIIHLS